MQYQGLSDRVPYTLSLSVTTLVHGESMFIHRMTLVQVRQVIAEITRSNQLHLMEYSLCKMQIFIAEFEFTAMLFMLSSIVLQQLLNPEIISDSV